MSPPLFTVIITTYGRPQFLAEAINSILSQSIEDFECIVVDDASPTPMTVPSDKRVRIIRRNENGGPGAARNTGMDESKGRYVAFLDDDDLFTPDRLALGLEGLRRGVPLALCWRSNVADGNQVRNRILDGDVHDVILNEEVPHIGQLSAVRSVLRPFDETFIAGEATEWWFRMTHLHPVTTVRRTGYLVRLHSAPRHRNTLEARIHFRSLFLERNREYLRQHPRAASYQHKKIGLLAQKLEDHALARNAFAAALRYRFDWRTYGHYVRSMRWSHPHSSKIDSTSES